MNKISLQEAFNIVSSATEPEFRHTNESAYMVVQSLMKLKEELQKIDQDTYPSFPEKEGAI